MISISFTQLSFLIASMAIVQGLLALWIKVRLEKSIQHEYDKQLEEYRFSQLQRQKAEIVARFFAKWSKYRGKEESMLDKNALIDYYEELCQMSFELSLWVEDEQLLNDIMSCFKLEKNSKDIRSLAGKVRKLILKKPADTFDSQNIVLWPNQEISERLFK
jgi:hypothetical protein